MTLSKGFSHTMSKAALSAQLAAMVSEHRDIKSAREWHARIWPNRSSINGMLIK